MTDQRVGAAFRAVRLRRGWRQRDVAARAGVSPALVSLIERGHIATLSVETLRRIGSELEVRIDLVARWRGGELDRLVNSGHSALAEAITKWLRSEGWTVAPEVSFAIYRESGIIDLLAWHAATRTLLVLELKTLIVDVNDLVGVTDRKTRLAMRIGDDRGWSAATVATLVVVADSGTNRRRVSAHSAVLKSAYPVDGRSVRAWVRRPAGPMSGLMFYANATPGSVISKVSGRQRVRRARSSSGQA